MDFDRHIDIFLFIYHQVLQTMEAQPHGTRYAQQIDCG